ncbi:MAG: transglutaminase-like domain-containing protein [Oscillospiraceae bacterium]
MLRGKVTCCAAMLLMAAALIFASSCTPSDDNLAKEAALPVNPDDIESRLEKVRVSGKIEVVSAKNDYVQIDVSAAHNGYILLQYDHEYKNKLKLKVEKGKMSYYYSLSPDGSPTPFPLQMGSGEYKISVLEQVEGDKYALWLTCSVDAALESENSAFLLPSQIVSYDRSSDAVQKGLELTSGALDDLTKVTKLFNYISQNIAYDYEKARLIKDESIVDYLPSVDKTLASGKGICYDYSALFAAMLRANGIPAKLIIGYAQPGDIYHAWNMIYITDVGWVGRKIYFDGKSWQLADTTFAATGEDSDVEYVPLREY